MAVQRPRVCVVPTGEVLDLAAELASLGGGDIAVGRCWAGVLCAAPDSAAASEAAKQLDACCPTAPAVVSVLQQQLWPWLRQGYSAAVLLLDAPATLTADYVVASAAAAAIAAGLTVGLTWQLVSASSIQDPEGALTPQEGTANKNAAAAVRQRPGGRPAQAATAEEQAPCTVRVTTAAEVDQLLAAASNQHRAACEGQHPTALLLHLRVLAVDGRPAGALHVLQPAAEQQPALLRLLEEVADLHQRRREGEHFLSAAKLSPLNELAAALLAGGRRLFLAACLTGGVDSKPGASPALLTLLRHARSIQSVCTRGAAGGAPLPATSSCPAAWLSAESYLKQLEERQQAEQRRRAEAAALAAAEADRREKLRLAAQQRQQQRQQQAFQESGRAAGQQAEDKDKPLQLSAIEQRSPARQPAPPERQQQRMSPPLDRPASPCVASEPRADDAQASSAPAADAAEAGNPDVRSSLDQLRQQFHTLYHQTVGSSAAAFPAQTGHVPGSLGEGTPYGYDRQQTRTSSIAAGLTAADEVAMHVAALRAEAAADALCARDAQGQLRADAQHAGSSPAELAGHAAEFSWTGRSPQGSGGLGQHSEGERAHAQWGAAEGAAAAQPAVGVQQGDGGSEADASQADASQADLASLADLDAPAASLAVLYRQPVSRLASSGSLQNPWSSPLEACRAADGQQSSLCQAAEGLPDAGSCTPGPLPCLWPELPPPAAPELAEPSQLVSDVFKSENLALGWPQRGPPHLTAAAAMESSPGWRDVPGPAGRYAQQPSEGSVGSSSVPPSSTSSRPVPQLNRSGGYASQRAASIADCSPSTGSASEQQQQQQQVGTKAWRADMPNGDSSQQHMHAAALQAEAQGTDVEALLDELQREQRLNGVLLQQLHQVQQQLEETAAAAVAAAAAAANPPAPGVEDPADFNGLLAALQLERQQHALLRRTAQLQEQQAEEARLALEAQLHTLQRQLLAATARCRAWEGQSPLPVVFRRYDEDMQRMQACCQRLEQENVQLARLLAEADLGRLSAAVQQLPADAAAVCREQHRKLQQAQQQIVRLQQERVGLQKQVQAAERRDRLAELCRRQAEAGHRAAAELRQQLAAREQQLEAQSLAAAAAAAESTRLREQLGCSEQQLMRVLAEKADLEGAVESLREQVALLRGQASRDRVLRCMQLPAVSP